jgi:nitrate/nitrite transporter NarK
MRCCFRRRGFTAANGVTFFLFVSLLGSLFMITQLFQIGLGYSPLEAGLRILVWMAMPMLVAPIAGGLADRFGNKPFMLAGLLLQGAGAGWLALGSRPSTPTPATSSIHLKCSSTSTAYCGSTAADVGREYESIPRTATTAYILCSTDEEARSKVPPGSEFAFPGELASYGLIGTTGTIHEHRGVRAGPTYRSWSWASRIRSTSVSFSGSPPSS